MDLRMNLLHEDEMVSTRDWRRALRAQPAYRIVNKTIRGQTTFISLVGLTGLVILFYFYTRNGGSQLRSSVYNYTYPLTAPTKTSTHHMYKIGIIADLDTNSKSPTEKNTWYSYLKTGYLSYNLANHAVVVTWDNSNPVKLSANFAYKDRGVELSELIVFDGRLLTFDDRTGLIYEIKDQKLYPWVLLLDGDGLNKKGFKSEWASVKDCTLYVGSMGKEWTTPNGDYENSNPQYIKSVTSKGIVNHINWSEGYKRLRSILGIQWPGYMIHESAVWSSIHQRWYFLPRRCSTERYNESLDEHRGCNVLLSADANLYDVEKVVLPTVGTTRGFSSFKFVPGSNDEVIVALKTEELNGNTATYVTAFTRYGHIVLRDSFVSDLKYEGLEFI